MKSLPLQLLADFSAGTLRGGDPARAVTQVRTDSRAVGAGDVFVALKGPRFDAHDFVPTVAAAGAAAIVVSRWDSAWEGLPCAFIVTADTTVALQRMAARYRAWHAPLVIGLTGSNGKTSTKDLAAAVMSPLHQTTATLGNLNNELGVPITLLSLIDGDACAVVEMGMNHPGEIKTLVDIAKPDAAILTNVGVAHIENMGSQDAIAWEKGTLAANVRPGGVVVLNSGDRYTPVIARHCQADVFTAGIGEGDVAAHDLRTDNGGTHFVLNFHDHREAVYLPVLGEHMVANAALAACMAWRQGVHPSAIADALQRAKLSKGRLEPKEVRGVLFIDDSYNANPDSMIAGLRTLASSATEGRRIAVLGRMGELGHMAEMGHAQVGELAATLPLDAIYSVGGGEAEMITQAVARTGTSVESGHFESHEACAAHLRDCLNAGDVVLLKGSRSAAMEKVLTLFEAS
ncbi:MAG: UDP-N-acetylmuramoyl-tripeptide--D-alanyl-D-alanine ligase [Verrucomicrobiales bacterium]|nr:UDP-N-acetylmuramoyl-tripeptide--D-alanyl-D-alanine ligase [Verrucomicrobiales bacterium]MCP5557434.1 UDP-N-acetylmuramoyl-tripeptide--D-alanyl-D-alanine ligase [Verrucomicrobiaceae bacterium]